MCSFEITFSKVCEFTVTVILVWFATCLNANNDVCRTLPAFIAVTAMCNVCLSFLVFQLDSLEWWSRKFTQFFVILDPGGWWWWWWWREAQPYLTAVLHYYGNLAHADWRRTRGKLWQLHASLLMTSLCARLCVCSWCFLFFEL